MAGVGELARLPASGALAACSLSWLPAGLGVLSCVMADGSLVRTASA